MKLHFLFPVLALFSSCLTNATTKVACVGDSITFGAGIEQNQPKYPNILAQLLGKGFEVRNFGNSGKTAGDFPSQKSRGRWYGDTKEYKDSNDFRADIYICNLGINDTGAWWDPKLFKTGYETLVSGWEKSNPKARFFAWGLLGPDFRGKLGKEAFPGNIFAPKFKYSERDNNSSANRKTAENLIEKVSKQYKIHLFDAYSPLASHPEWYKDGLHPTASGAKRIAEITFAKLANILSLTQPTPVMTVEQESVIISNMGDSALLLDGWKLGSPKTRGEIYTFGNQTVIAPKSAISVSLQPHASQSENDPTKALVYKTTAKGTELKLIQAPHAKSAGLGKFSYIPQK